MHAEVMEHISKSIDLVRSNRKTGLRVLDIGGRDVNGSPRGYFTERDDFTSIDLIDGPGVDIVADVVFHKFKFRYDFIICASVFEHVPHWPLIVCRASELLNRDGLFTVTTVSDPWPKHSAEDGGPLRTGEYYGNISHLNLSSVLRCYFYFSKIVDDENGNLLGIAAHRQGGAYFNA